MNLSDRIAARSGLCHFKECQTPTGNPELGYCEPHLREVNRSYRRPQWVVLAQDRRLPPKDLSAA